MMEDEFEQAEEAEPQDEYGQWLAGLTPEEQREVESDPPQERLPRSLEAARNRLKKLQDRGMHVSPSEARERAGLQEAIPLMEARIQENERAEGFYGLDDESLAARAIGDEESMLEAQHAFKSAKANLAGLMGGLHTAAEQRVLEGRVRQAESAYTAAVESAIGTRGEVERRDHIAAHGDLDQRVPTTRQLERKLLADLRTMVSPQETPDAALTPDGRVEQLRSATAEVLEGVSKELGGEVNDERQESAS